MNSLFKYLGLLIQIAVTLDTVKASIDAKVPTSTPPVNTYIDGVHVAVTVVLTPLDQPAVTIPAAAIAEAHETAKTPPVVESAEPVHETEPVV